MTRRIFEVNYHDARAYPVSFKEAVEKSTGNDRCGIEDRVDGALQSIDGILALLVRKGLIKEREILEVIGLNPDTYRVSGEPHYTLQGNHGNKRSTYDVISEVVIVPDGDEWKASVVKQTVATNLTWEDANKFKQRFEGHIA